MRVGKIRRWRRGIPETDDCCCGMLDVVDTVAVSIKVLRIEIAGRLARLEQVALYRLEQAPAGTV